MFTLLIALVACEQSSGKSQEVLGSNAALSPIEKTCKRAYTGRQGAVDKYKQSLRPEDAEKIPAMPDKQEFITLCSKLPEEAAKCLDPNWYQVDAESCNAALEAANKDDIEAVDKLLQGLPTGDDEEKEEAGEAPEGAEPEEKPEGGAGALVEQAMKQGE